MTIEQKKEDHDLLLKEKDLLHNQVRILQSELFSMKSCVQVNELLFEQLTIAQEELFAIKNIASEHRLLLRVFKVLKDNAIFRSYFSNDTWHILNQINLTQFSDGKEVLYGAPERIKEGVTYQLGAVMIKKSRSFTGLLSLPFILSRMKKEYNSNIDNILLERFSPKIEEYADAHEAMKYKQHLSYRLGSIFEEKSNTFLGRIKMPFSLFFELRRFRRSK